MATLRQQRRQEAAMRLLRRQVVGVNMRRMTERRKQYLVETHSAVTLQAWWRKVAARRQFRRQVVAVRVVQRWLRTQLACRRMATLRLAVIVVQRKWRARQVSRGQQEKVLRLRGGAQSEDSTDDEDLEDENRNDENQEERTPETVKRCIYCKQPIKSTIPHLNKEGNERCKEEYLKQYNAKDIKTLQKRFKTQNQKRKRSHDDYRLQMNKARKESRNENIVDDMKSFKEFFNSIEGILSEKCQGCQAFVSRQHVKILADGDKLYEDLMLEELIEDNDKIYICKWCNKIQNDLLRWLDMGGEDEEYLKEYKDWAYKTFTLDNKLSTMLNNLNRIDKSASIGMNIFNDYEGRHSVVFPFVNYNGVKIEIEENQDGIRKLEPTILLPQELFEEDITDSLSKQEVELANRSLDLDFLNLLNVLIKDRLGIMKSCKTMRQARNSETKKGMVENNQVELNEIDSLKGCLSKVKGTQEYQSQQIENIKFRQCQNGYKNIKFRWIVFSGYQHIQTDPYLAVCLLKQNGHIIKFLEKPNEDGVPNRDYRVCCQVDCDPFNCNRQLYHPTALEKLKTSECAINPLVVARFIHGRIQAFVNKVVRPRAKDYSLFLCFDRPTSQDGDSGFWLCGNIWVEDLDFYNSSGQPIEDV